MSDPDLHITLDDSAHRAACYRCHPGSTTKCLRGAMGGAIAKDGSLEMQCQSCHGNMSQVGSPHRTGWLEEPNCQSCHTGTATSNNGQIRYVSSFTDTNWTVRVAVNQTFATKSNTPAAGISLYRFSTGHGGLQCSACHGSTHAEFPATHRNDNIRNERIQGHAGVMVECTACHVSMAVNSTTAAAGPHGMHPIGQAWADNHGDLLEGNSALRAGCRNCHGTDSRGTELSRMQASRTIPTKDNKYGTKDYWRGRSVSCYDCHNGSNSSDPSSNPPAVVSGVATNTLNNASVSFVLPATDGNGNALTFRIVSQPVHGSAGVSNNVATYFPEPGFAGTDAFTYAANDGYSDSNLGTNTVVVNQGAISISAKALVPPSYPAQWDSPFGVVATPVNTTSNATFVWDFGDGTQSTTQFTTHAYALPGNYTWQVVSRVQQGAVSASVTNSGTLVIEAPATVSGTISGGGALLLTWPNQSSDALLEETGDLMSGNWTVATNNVSYTAGGVQVNVPATSGARFYRLRRL